MKSSNVLFYKPTTNVEPHPAAAEEYVRCLIYRDGEFIPAAFTTHAVDVAVDRVVKQPEEAVRPSLLALTYVRLYALFAALGR